MNLEDRLAHDPHPWQPEPGEVVIGTILELSERTGDYGSYPFLSIDTKDGEVEVHAFHSVLRNRIYELDLRVGDEIGIKYVGKVNPKGGGSSYQSYRVITGGRAPKPAVMETREEPAAMDPEWGPTGDEF